MIVGVLYLELYLPGMQNRKEKRAVVNSLKQKIKNSHNVALSEVGFQDLLQRCAIGISTVSLGENEAQNLFDKIYNQICEFPAVQITKAEKEYY